MITAAAARLERLMEFLRGDPDNSALLTDAAETALTAGSPLLARDLLAQRLRKTPATGRERNLEGIIALALNEFEIAREVFARLLENSPGDTALRFNLAWAERKMGQPENALALLDETVTGALPQAALVEVQILHSTGDFDKAIAAARRHIVRHPQCEPLMATVSVLALDVEDSALARACALSGGDHPDALTTRGVLALEQGAPEEALAHFDDAITRESRGARSWIGRGLARLALGEHAAAADDIDKGAEIFGDHLGSYIAAGWAHLIMGDVHGAEARFRKALALDDNFGETHGSLAVVAAIRSDLDDARTKAKTAIRLDKACFSARFAQSLILAAEGSGEAGRKVFDAMLQMPIEGSGRTIAQFIARMGVVRY